MGDGVTCDVAKRGVAMWGPKVFVKVGVGVGAGVDAGGVGASEKVGVGFVGLMADGAFGGEGVGGLVGIEW